jgi:hypothetical protein
VGRRGGAEVEHLPAVGLEEVGHHLDAERMALLRAARHDGEPAVLGRRPHARPEHAEHGLGGRRRAVLVGDREVPDRPAATDLVERRLQDREVDLGHRDALLERGLDHAPRGAHVAREQRLDVGPAMIADVHRPGAGYFRTVSQTRLVWKSFMVSAS